MFFKNNKVIIQSNEIPINLLQNFLLDFPKNIPSYFKSIPRTFYDNLNRPLKNKKNLRTCSGFINLFKRSLVFTSPYDIEIFVTNGKISGSVGQQSLENNFVVHENWQFLHYVKSDYAFILKFTPFVRIKSDYSILVSNPWWHLNDFEIIPGMINCLETSELNIFIPIKRNQNYLYIKQNTPLCYLNFETSKQLKIKYKKEKYSLSEYNGLYYKFSNLKRKLLNNILKKENYANKTQ